MSDSPQVNALGERGGAQTPNRAHALVRVDCGESSTDRNGLELDWQGEFERSKEMADSALSVSPSNLGPRIAELERRVRQLEIDRNSMRTTMHELSLIMYVILKAESDLTNPTNADTRSAALEMLERISNGDGNVRESE